MRRSSFLLKESCLAELLLTGDFGEVKATGTTTAVTSNEKYLIKEQTQVDKNDEQKQGEIIGK